MDRTTASTTTSKRTSKGSGDQRATSRAGERRGAERARPTRTPHPTYLHAAAKETPLFSGCSGPGRTRDEAADLAVDWLVHDPTTGAAHTARFHHACQPGGVPGELACARCGDGPLLDPTLTAMLAGTTGAVDLFTAAALTGWLDDHGWTGDPHPAAHPAGVEHQDEGEGPYCPTCSPRSARPRRAAAGVPR